MCGSNASLLRIEPTLHAPLYRQHNHKIIYIRTFCVYGSGVMLGRRAASGVGKYNAESPKQGSKRFNSITKTIHFAHLGI